MIIVEGPDGTGKTTLVKRLSEHYLLPYSHHTRESTYQDYLKPLCNLSLRYGITDRWIFSEHPYSLAMERKFAFSLKEWHNIVLLTLAHNPLIILCTHKPVSEVYSRDQYLPYNKWDQCLDLYRQLFDTHHIRYIEYDYSEHITDRALLLLESRHNDQMTWWEPMWKSGYGYIGSPNPEFLLIAERIGPNNVNNLPFETGPTGHMLSDMLQHTCTPLGKFAVTNMVKSYRRDPRPPNDNDVILLTTELLHLKPRVAVFMGSVAKQHGIKVAKDLGIETVGMTHFGYYSHKGITDMSALYNQWTKIIGSSPTKEDKNEEARDGPAVSFT